MKSLRWDGTVTRTIKHPERKIGLATCAGSKVSSFMGGIGTDLNAITAPGQPSRISVS
jgi:Ca2+/Na+ antiporter